MFVPLGPNSDKLGGDSDLSDLDGIGTTLERRAVDDDNEHETGDEANDSGSDEDKGNVNGNVKGNGEYKEYGEYGSAVEDDEYACAIVEK